MTCPPIPPAAMPVVERIRAEVPRPEKLPRAGLARCPLRWRYENGNYCPIGLLPGQLVPAPAEDVVVRLDQSAAGAFIGWFDRLKRDHAAAAMDLIWPPRGEGT